MPRSFCTPRGEVLSIKSNGGDLCGNSEGILSTLCIEVADRKNAGRMPLGCATTSSFRLVNGAGSALVGRRRKRCFRVLDEAVNGKF
jgi:hypothetical protein